MDTFKTFLLENHDKIYPEYGFSYNLSDNDLATTSSPADCGRLSRELLKTLRDKHKKWVSFTGSKVHAIPAHGRKIFHIDIRFKVRHGGYAADDERINRLAIDQFAGLIKSVLGDGTLELERVHPVTITGVPFIKVKADTVMLDPKTEISLSGLWLVLDCKTLIIKKPDLITSTVLGLLRVKNLKTIMPQESVAPRWIAILRKYLDDRDVNACQEEMLEYPELKELAKF